MEKCRLLAARDMAVRSRLVAKDGTRYAPTIVHSATSDFIARTRRLAGDSRKSGDGSGKHRVTAPPIQLYLAARPRGLYMYRHMYMYMYMYM